MTIKQLLLILLVLGILNAFPVFAVTCNQTINVDTTLTKNYNSSTTGFCINASHITLDCANYNITGGLNEYGILANNQINITIQNCNIYNFSDGLLLNSTSNSHVMNTLSDDNRFNFASKGVVLFKAHNNKFINVTTFNNRQAGFYLDHSNNNTFFRCIANSTGAVAGFYMDKSNFTNLTRNRVFWNNGDGFYFLQSTNAFVKNNTVYSNNDGIILSGNSHHAKVTDNLAYNNWNPGIRASWSDNATITDNIVYGTQGWVGFNFFESSNNTIGRNRAYNNSQAGFSFDSNSDFNYIFNNSVFNNSGGGFNFTSCDRNNFVNNSIHDNAQTGVSLDYSRNNSLMNNRVYNNGARGINVYRSNNVNVTNNTVYHNTGHGVLVFQQGGGQPGSNTRVTRNSIYDNGGSGVYLYFTNNEFVINNSITNNNGSGIRLGLVVVGNNITLNTVLNHTYSIQLINASNNTIYNNYFGNKPTADAASTSNDWNISKTPGTNIIGGPNLGGNFWLNYNGTDLNDDGIGDTEIPWRGVTKEIVNGGDFMPLINTYVRSIACEFNSSGTFANCTDAAFFQNITRVRVFCTSNNGRTANATFNLTNLYDSNTFFINTTSDNSTGFFVLDNTDVQILDSGGWRLSAICTNESGVSQSGFVDFNIPFGNISVSMPIPAGNANVTANRTFNVTCRLQCVGGECVNTTATLDPITAGNNPGKKIKQEDSLDWLWIIFILSLLIAIALTAIAPKNKLAWIFVLTMLVMVAGCGERFISINQPGTANEGDTVCVNITVNSTAFPPPFNGRPWFAVQIPNNWTVINATTGIPYRGGASGNFTSNATVTRNASRTFGNKTNYTWWGFAGNPPVNPVQGSFTNGTICFNATTAGNFLIDYHVGQNWTAWSDNSTNISINVTAADFVRINSISISPDKFPIGGGTQLTCIANVTGSNTIVAVYFNVTLPDATVLNLGNGTKNGDIWNSSAFLANLSGTYNCTVHAVDNESINKTDSFLFRAGLKGAIPMNSGYPFYTRNQNPRYPANQSCLNSLVPGQNCDTSWNVTVNSSVGDTWIFFCSYDNPQGDANTSEINITVTRGGPPPPPPPTPSGGGGATRQYPQECIEDWSCTPWSACIAGLQTRTCTDANKCGTTNSKPAESLTCAMPVAEFIEEEPASPAESSEQEKRSLKHKTKIFSPSIIFSKRNITRITAFLVALVVLLAVIINFVRYRPPETSAKPVVTPAAKPAVKKQVSKPKAKPAKKSSVPKAKPVKMPAAKQMKKKSTEELLRELGNV